MQIFRRYLGFAGIGIQNARLFARVHEEQQQNQVPSMTFLFIISPRVHALCCELHYGVVGHNFNDKFA